MAIDSGSYTLENTLLCGTRKSLSIKIEALLTAVCLQIKVTVRITIFILLCTYDGKLIPIHFRVFLTTPMTHNLKSIQMLSMSAYEESSTPGSKELNHMRRNLGTILRTFEDIFRMLSA